MSGGGSDSIKTYEIKVEGWSGSKSEPYTVVPTAISASSEVADYFKKSGNTIVALQDMDIVIMMCVSFSVSIGTGYNSASFGLYINGKINTTLSGYAIRSDTKYTRLHYNLKKDDSISFKGTVPNDSATMDFDGAIWIGI